jgi:CheY-like chemotaxis protein
MEPARAVEVERRADLATMAAKPDSPERFKVLLVEDDDFQRSAIGSLCEKCGYRVQAVASGEECAALIDASREDVPPWDLVFCDVWLGGAINGVDILLRLRRRYNAGISIIMVSSNDQSHIVEQCILEGADSFLLKALSLQEVSAAKSFVLRRRRQQAATCDSSLGIAAVEKAMSSSNPNSASWESVAPAEASSSGGLPADAAEKRPRALVVSAIRGAVSAAVASLFDVLSAHPLSAMCSPASSAASPSSTAHNVQSVGPSPLWGADVRAPSRAAMPSALSRSAASWCVAARASPAPAPLPPLRLSLPCASPYHAPSLSLPSPFRSLTCAPAPTAARALALAPSPTAV